MIRFLQIFCYLMAFLLFSNFFSSCLLQNPNPESRSSESDDDDGDDGDGDDGDGRDRNERSCSDRDSCQDICDDIFEENRERHDCYDMSFSEVNVLSEVADVLYDNNLKLDDLEDDITADDLASFLRIGIDSFVKVIRNEFETDRRNNRCGTNPGDTGRGRPDCYPWENGNTIRSENARLVLQWIAENDDIASTFLSADQDFELARALFINADKRIDSSPIDFLSFPIQATNSVVIKGSHSMSISSPVAPSCGDAAENTLLFLEDADGDAAEPTVSDDGDGQGPIGGTTGKCEVLEDFRGFDDKDNVENFLYSYMIPENGTVGRGENDIFLAYADIKTNEAAIEWAHGALVDFCIEGTDSRDSDDDDVKKCLQSVYCSIYQGPDKDIFELLDDHEDIVGNTRGADSECEFENLDDDNDLEDFYE